MEIEMKTYEQVVNQAALSNLHGYFGGGDMYRGYRDFASAAHFIYGVTNDRFFEDSKAAFDAALRFMNEIDGNSDQAVKWLEEKAIALEAARVWQGSADRQGGSFDDWEKMDRGWN
jgi:hypothetical protein